MSWSLVIAFGLGFTSGIACLLICALAMASKACDDPDPRSQRRG